MSDRQIFECNVCGWKVVHSGVATDVPKTCPACGTTDVGLRPTAPQED